MNSRTCTVPPAMDVSATEKPKSVKAADRAAPGNASRVLAVTLRWFLAVLLVWAGLSKLADPVHFHGAVLEYQLPLAPVITKLTAVILPWMEIFCGLLLVAGVARRATLLWVTALFVVFLAMVGQAYLRGLDVSCGCFELGALGIEEHSPLGQFLESLGFAILRNVILLGTVFVLWKLTNKGEQAATESAERR